MLRALAFLLVVYGANTFMVRADTVNFVELFVSQNCPACPAAQENLVELQETDGPFISLIWVIDYWDYVDEPDPMAIPESSARQRMYAEALGIRGPYTPQLIVNGAAHVAGNRKKRVRNLLADQREANARSESLVSLETTDTSVRVIGAEDADPLELWIMGVDPMERYGLSQPNAVTKVDGPYDWTGGTLDIDYTCENRCVAVVQGMDRGPVEAATVFGGDAPA
ncbi:MAG: DUF1223 domain-containing protein [Pseudomonadota bacterium]